MMLTMSRTPWIAYHQPLPNAQLRLCCFHHAGGGASAFRQWGQWLQPYGIELCPIQLPGRENRLGEQPTTDLPHVIDQLMQVLARYTDLPLAFFGHSMGGLIAFYLAQRFQQRGRPLRRLIISATTPPHLAPTELAIHQLPDHAFIDAVARFNGLPHEVLQNRELMGLLLPTLRADFILCERPSGIAPTLLHTGLSVFTGLQDDRIKEADLVQWQGQTTGPVKIRKFPGDHFFLYQQPRLVVGAIIQDLLAVKL